MSLNINELERKRQLIASRRKRLNISQEQLGRALGVSRESVVNYENDGKSLKLERLIEIMATLTMMERHKSVAALFATKSKP